ncbi:hypothetical protein LSAT2_012862 [Lamellibrachia satsuma]|nr:hypothetical protein LSAT2_012862 [Lamellibrachia satsuma]
MLTLQRVPQSRSIQVHSIDNIPEEIIMLYFESERRSGGGEVANIHFCQGEEYALLEFVECATARCILAKDNHTILNRLLHVTIYYECLGLMFPNYKTKPDSWFLMSVRVRGLNARVLIFLQGSAESRQLVNTDMASVSAVVEWHTYERGRITLTSTVRDIAKDPRRLYKTWSQTASDTFKQLLATNFTSQQLWTLH